MNQTDASRSDVTEKIANVDDALRLVSDIYLHASDDKAREKGMQKINDLLDRRIALMRQRDQK